MSYLLNTTVLFTNCSKLLHCSICISMFFLGEHVFVSYVFFLVSINLKMCPIEIKKNKKRYFSHKKRKNTVSGLFTHLVIIIL